MKSKLITLSIVWTAATLSVSAQEPPLKPGEPPRLPNQTEFVDKTHPHDNDEVDLPEDLKEHREHFKKIQKEEEEEEERQKQTSDTKANDQEDSASQEKVNVNVAEPSSESNILENESVDKKWRKFIKTGDESAAKGRFGAATSKYKRALAIAEKLSNGELLVAITNKRLGEGYINREKYIEAREFLKNARTFYRKAGKKEDGINPLLARISKFYKELDFHKFGEKVAKYFEDAKVQRIRVFKEDDLTKFKVELASKFIRPVESKKVKKVKFNQIVSFDFKALPNDHYGLENVRGLQVRTKKLWVNLLSSVLGPNSMNQPEAEITGGKLGKEKTVVVKVPDDIYDQSQSILDELKKAINSSKYDAALIPEEEQEPKTKSKEEETDRHPPNVIHSIDEPVQPDAVAPHSPYNEVIDTHLNEDKPPVMRR